MAHLKQIISFLNEGNTRVFKVVLITAFLVTLVRLFGPLLVSWDLSIQLEAAHRMAQGLGLTNAFSPQQDLSQPPISETLVHFPPGISVLVAAFLYLGFSLAVSLKIIYTLTTVIGWVAWAAIASQCLEIPIKIGGKTLPANLIIAVILPFIYTPSWTIQGTDIFLWAGVPIVTLLLLYTLRNSFSLGATILLGLTIGFLVSFRYASGFLLITTFLIASYKFFPKIKSILAFYGTFSLSFSIIILPIFLFNNEAKAQSSANSLSRLVYDHGAKNLSEDHSSWILESVSKIFSSFSSLFFLTGIDPRRIQDFLAHHILLNSIVGLFFLLLFCSLPILLVRYRISAYQGGDNVRNFTADISFLLSCVIVSFIMFSVAITPVLAYSPLVIERYYYPLKSCLILIAYGIIAIPSFSRISKSIAKMFVIIFMLFNTVALAYYSHAYGSRSLATLPFGLEPSINFDIQYPSNTIVAERKETLQFLVKLEEQNPDALFFAQHYPRYMGYANFRYSLNIRRIPDHLFWENAYLSNPTKIFWVIEGDCPLVCASSGFFNSDSDVQTIPALESLPNLEPVFFSKKNRTKIMATDLPAGYRFQSR
ncbi:MULTISPECIES: hypothetical protein [Cyanophyceae]|uniref:hypothetical protein n=1 Tax=Cyanophyceae TaxID=3028117 RepID=UPI00168493BD|nr:MULTISPECIES: hypothetical protein [Cyanophyceae]MBD1918209.1 hypothetical protein [Phormidium sp. FACHB-77]MBD2030241.1 hypothetical protein [Phormidium sp. FACHB-322]MBD2051387.1 hypothetical protein [Leptolyngbya sp. FACHB-60]